MGLATKPGGTVRSSVMHSSSSHQCSQMAILEAGVTRGADLQVLQCPTDVLRRH